METECMDYNTSKFEEGMGILSDVFCRVPNNFFLSALRTNNLLFFYTSKTNKNDCYNTARQCCFFAGAMTGYLGKSCVPCLVLVYLPEKCGD